MDAAKIRLSKEEEELVLNADWILTKNAILEKVKLMLADMQERQLEWIKASNITLPQEVIDTNGKISRGENYKGLPWLILDQPRVFGKEDVMAIRIFFWWGNFFSCTLQLSGKYKQEFQMKLIEAYDMFAKEGYFIGINTDPWEHHFGDDNYLPIASLNESEYGTRVLHGSFIKLSKRISLKHWKEAGMNLEETFRQYIKLLQSNYQGGETGL